MRDEVGLAKVHLRAQLQAARRAVAEGRTRVRYGRRVVQVALPVEKEILPHPGPVADGQLPRALPE